jgi:uncharacterized membrane protein
MTARGRLLLVLALGAGYALVSLWLMIRMPGSLLALLVVLGPMTGLALLGLWRRGTRLPALLLALLAGALAFVALRGDVNGFSPNLLYLLQHAGIHAVLAAGFGATLFGGAVPLITRLAARLHPLGAVERAYTRRVTAVWTLYFATMVVVSVLLFAASFTAWSWFANVATPLSALALFGGEHLLRYRLHPEFERVTMAAAWQAYARADAGPSSAAAAAPAAPLR